jgi:hypothetical protein
MADSVAGVRFDDCQLAEVGQDLVNRPRLGALPEPERYPAAHRPRLTNYRGLIRIS